MPKFYLFIILLSLSINSSAQSKIYLIRHAAVQIEKPGWCTAQTAHNYREEYQINSVKINNANAALDKIDNPATIDTVFCSPLVRAVETANMLFNNQVELKINDNLKELDYEVIKFPFLRLPVRVWHTISLLKWMRCNFQSKKPTYKQRKQSLKVYSDEIITYAETHGKSVVVAHGVLNRELIKVLKKKGWKLEHKDGYKNLSVNCLVK